MSTLAVNGPINISPFSNYRWLIVACISLYPFNLLFSSNVCKSLINRTKLRTIKEINKKECLELLHHITAGMKTPRHTKKRKEHEIERKYFIVL